ncbi:MAG: hypothetical protein JNN12_00450 [Bacteroidetes Order II. Incertae sedis bacterium]|nr:hypothetical protein [Bacteroidetes Order II. bacterium]
MPTVVPRETIGTSRPSIINAAIVVLNGLSVLPTNSTTSPTLTFPSTTGPVSIFSLPRNIKLILDVNYKNRVILRDSPFGQYQT